MSDETITFPMGDDRHRMLDVQRGDRQAFAELVRKHQQSLLNYFNRSGVYNDAEDLVQRTFIKLYSYRDRYRPTAKFTTFLYLLARQVWIDELRRNERRRRLRLTLEADAVFQEGQRPTRRTPGLADDLQSALSQLPEKQRAVVVLGVLQQMTYPEIAKVLKIPVGTVKSRMFIALRALRGWLDENREGNDS